GDTGAIGTASATTPKPEPKLVLDYGGTFGPELGCSASKCTRMKVTYTNLPSGSYTVKIFQKGAQVRSYSETFGASGEWQSDYGVVAHNNNGDIYVTFTGGGKTYTSNTKAW